MLFRSKILVISYPGPVPPLGKNNINAPIITPPRYRNRRLGDFFKELELTEGRCTGFPKIRRALRANGSPAPVFQTDSDREYFMVTIKVHPKAKEMAAKITPGKAVDRVTEKVTEKVTENQRKIIEGIMKNPNIVIAELTQLVGISERKIKENISKLKAKNMLRRIGPDKGGHWEVIK